MNYNVTVPIQTFSEDPSSARFWIMDCLREEENVRVALGTQFRTLALSDVKAPKDLPEYYKPYAVMATIRVEANSPDEAYNISREILSRYTFVENMKFRVKCGNKAWEYPQ